MSAIAPVPEIPTRSPVHITADPVWQGILDKIETFLTNEGIEQMRAEVGRALMESLRQGDDEPIARCADAWLRTLLFKVDGAEELLDEPVPPDAPVVTVEQLRSRWT